MRYSVAFMMCAIYRLRQYLRHAHAIYIRKFRLFVKSTSPQNILATPLLASRLILKTRQCTSSVQVVMMCQDSGDDVTSVPFLYPDVSGLWRWRHVRAIPIPWCVRTLEMTSRQCHPFLYPDVSGLWRWRHVSAIPIPWCVRTLEMTSRQCHSYTLMCQDSGDDVTSVPFLYPDVSGLWRWRHVSAIPIPWCVRTVEMTSRPCHSYTLMCQDSGDDVTSVPFLYPFDFIFNFLGSWLLLKHRLCTTLSSCQLSPVCRKVMSQDRC